MPLPTFETDTTVAPNLPDFGTTSVAPPSPVLSKVRTAPEMQISAKDPGIKPMGAVEGAASILNLVLEKLGRGAVGAYNKVIDYNTAHLSPDVRNEKSVPQRVEYGKPLVDLSSLSPAVKEIIGRVITAPVGLGLPSPIQRGVGESVTKTLSGFSTPENIALMPALPLKPVQAVIGTQMALNSPTSVAEAARTVGDPGKGTQEKTSSIVDALTQLAMTGGLLKGAMSKGEVTKPATPQEMTGVQLLADQVKKGILTPEQAGVDESGKSIETPASLNLAPPRAVETPAPTPTLDLTPVKAVEAPPPTVEAPKLPTFEPELKPVETVVAPVVETPVAQPPVSEPPIQQPLSITPEQTVSLQHDLKGVAGTIASAKQLKQITPEQATELQNDGDQIFTQLMTDNDYTKAQAAVENLRKKRDSFVSTKPKETPASLGTTETKKPDVLRTAIEGPKAYVPKERITDVSPTRIPGATADLDEIARKVTTKGEELTPMENAYLTSIVGKPEHQAYLKKVRELRTGGGSKPFTDTMPAPPEKKRLMTKEELDVENEKASKLGYKGYQEVANEHKRLYIGEPTDTLYQQTKGMIDEYVDDHPEISKKTKKLIEETLYGEEANSKAAQIHVITTALDKVLKKGERPTADEEALVSFIAKNDPDLVDAVRRNQFNYKDGAIDFAIHQLRDLGFVDHTKHLLLNDWGDFRQQVYEKDPGLYDWINHNIHPDKDLGPMYGEGTEWSDKPISLTTPPTDKPRSFTQAIESVTDSSHRTKWEAMDLKEGDNINDVIRKIAAKPEVFGKTYSGLAKFLDENFSHVLPIYSVTHESHPVTGRATIDLDKGFRSGNKIYLGIGSDATTDPAYSAIHEAAHAAIHWQFMYPKTGLQRKAAAVISDIMSKSVESLPENVRKFYTEVWEPFAKDNRLATRESWRGVFYEMHKRGIEDRWSGVMFSLGNPSEFLAQSLSSLSHQSFLADWKYEGKTAWIRFKDAVKDLLGIKSGTALDAVIDQVITVGKEADADAVFDFESKATMTVPPTSPLSVVHDATTSEKYKGFINAIAGRTAPKTSAVSVDAANNLIRYASARIAAPLVARSMATDVLGRQQHDPVFSRLLGSIIVEDQLRGVREGFRSMATKATDPAEKAEFLDKASKVTTIIGKPESPLTSEAQFTRLLKSPAIAEAIQRHNNSIMPVAEQAHKELGGASARGGEATGAFANLIAILSPDDVEGTRALVYGSRQGELTNPLKRGSSFSKQRRGTASAYELDYRTIAERMIRGNYEQKALRDMYKSLVERGLAVEEKPGVTPPRTLGDKPLEKVTIEIRGAGPGQTRQRNLWIRSDVAQEVRQALATDSPIVKGGLGLLLDAATDVQIVGVTDAWWHTVNMAAAISTSQGGKNIWVDVARKIPGVAVADAVARVSHQYIRTLLDDADVQRELGQIAEVGAGRATPVHRGILTKGAQALGLEGGANPFNWSANFIKAVDKAGRLSLNKMYDNLVERKVITDTPEGRREFINKMGQYNSRLMGQVQKFAREISLSSFVVAGRNFNRLAMQKLLMDPGVEAANPGAAVKMRAVELFGWTSALLILPVVANHAINGTLFGRPGTPYGSIDTGKDDENGRPIVVDPLQTMLLRRGLRISGAQSLMKDVNEGVGAKRTAHDMANDIFQGIVHPWTGPAVRTGKIAVSGYDTSGYLVSRNPDDHWENVKAALKNANPMIAAYLRGKEATGTKAGGVGEVAKSTITRAVGVGKSGSLPSWEDRVNATTKKVEAGTLYADTGFSMLPIGERRKVQKELDTERSQRPKMDETLRREMARRSQFRGYARLDALSDSLPDEQRSWLKANNLHLTEFKDELTAAKTRIPFTRNEEERFATIVAENYKERLTALMQPDMESTVAEWKKSGRLQKMLDARLDMARKRARATMRSEISKKASGN